MEQTTPGPMLPDYDYRLYDQIWQRVSPELDPYPEVRAAARQAVQPQPAPVPAPRREEPLQGETCCMGAGEGALSALEGLMEEELAGRQHCLALARRTRSGTAARLLCRMAGEKGAAAQRLRTACFLITGSRRAPSLTVEPRGFSCLADALRSCYHQEACVALRYRRAAHGTEDVCLQRLLQELGDQAFRRADAVMELLQTILR